MPFIERPVICYIANIFQTEEAEFACEFVLPSEEISSDLDKIRTLYERGEIEEAEILLQKCIDRERLPSHDFMKQIRDESSDESVKNSIVKMHFLNFV